MATLTQPITEAPKTTAERMEFTCDTKTLREEVGVLGAVPDKRVTIPILGHLLIEARDNMLTITANNLELALTVQVPAQVKSEGKATVEAKRFGDFLRTLPDGELSAKLGANDRLYINCQNTRINLAGLPPESFPESQRVDGNAITLSAGEWLDILHTTKHAVTRAESRHALGGVILNATKDGVYAVSTDGVRLASVHLPSPIGVRECNLVIAQAAFSSMERLFSSVEEKDAFAFSYDDNLLQFEAGSRRLTIRKMDMKPLQWRRLLVDSFQWTVTLSRVSLKAALERARLLIGDTGSAAVTMQINADHVRVASCYEGRGEFSEPISCEGDGTGLEAHVNASYILETLSVLKGERVKIGMAAGLRHWEFGTDDGADAGKRLLVIPMWD